MVNTQTYYQGDTIKFVYASADFAAGDGWTIVYHFANNDFTTTATAIANEDGNYITTISAEDSSLWPAGKYMYQVKASRDDVVATLTCGDFNLISSITNRSKADRFDNRSEAQIIVENIDSYLANPESIEASKIMIADREISRHNLNELRKLREVYKAIWDQERVNSGEKIYARRYVRVIPTY